MLNENDYTSACEKVRHTAEIAEIRANLYEEYKRLFNTILDDELTYGEMLALSEYELKAVYDEFGSRMSNDN